jgi:hypothetical protein
MDAIERAVIHWKHMTRSAIYDGYRGLLVDVFRREFEFDPDDIDAINGRAFAAVNIPGGLIEFEMSICPIDECQGESGWRPIFDGNNVKWVKYYCCKCNGEQVGVKAQVIVPLACIKPAQE